MAATRTVLPHPAEMLRALLNDPKPKDEFWQEQAGRSVSLLAVAFFKEPDEHEALRSVALLTLAQGLGVKEARKRSMKLTRWAEMMPPMFSALTTKDEQQAALLALAKLTAPWSRRYAELALADLATPDELVPDLLKWARTTFVDVHSFTREVYAPLIASCRSSERPAILLKDASRLLRSTKPDIPEHVAETISVLIDSFCRSAPPGAPDEKAMGSSIAALLHLVQDQTTAMPALLLQPVFVLAVSRLTEVASKGSASKQVAIAAEALSLATVSLLMADIDRTGRSAVAHWRLMMPGWKAAYPRWSDHLTSAAVISPGMAAVTSADLMDSPTTGDTYASEAVFARLMPAWDAFVADLPDASRASSLGAMLRQAAETVGVVPMGKRGEVVSYDPLSHHLTSEESTASTQVRIARPGVQVLRADGSTRVLVAALVTAV